MSRTKEKFFDEINFRSDQKFIDDAYQYEAWQKEMRKQFGDPPLASVCCNAGIIYGNGYYTICRECLKICKVA